MKKMVLATLLALGLGCETTETTGSLTAREVKVGEDGAITLVNGRITLTDSQGNKSVLTASKLTFYAPDGKELAALPAPKATR